MKRDLNLIRAILFAVEACEASVMPLTPSVKGYSKEQIVYHIRLMIENSLLEAIPMKSAASVLPLEFREIQLTSKGHNFLDNARNDTVWKKVLAEAESKGMSTTVFVVNALLSKCALKYAGLD